jgi:hypothetical protein
MTPGPGRARHAPTGAIDPLTASRTWSCQYRTGPDEAGRSGTASREDHTRSAAAARAR